MYINEVFVKINGDNFYFWRAINHEGTILNYYVSKRCNKRTALKVLRKHLSRYGIPREIVSDITSDKLKKLVQGIIWRDEHFGGMTLKDIALRENCSEGYVGTAIFGSFDILKKTFPVNLQKTPCSR